MTHPRVDYDKIAPHYNRCFEAEQPEGTRAALVSLANFIGAKMILEVGCGTAYWLAALEEGMARYQRLYGLDYSFGILEQASQRQRNLKLFQKKAENLPVENETLDLIYCVNAIHHFADPETFIHEIQRALRPGGSLAVIRSNPHGRFSEWYISEYFPGTYQRHVKRFPTWGAIINWVIQAGFSSFDWRLTEHIQEPRYGSLVLTDPFLEKNAVSQLALLSDQEYSSGIERINEKLDQAERSDEELVFNCDIYVHILTASRRN